MDERGIAARVHDLPDLPRRGVIALLLLAAMGLAWWGLTSTVGELPIALWWPTVGLTTAAILASRGRRVTTAIIVFVLVTLINAAAGRPVELSLVYGFANALEAWIIVWMLTRARPHARMVTLPEGGRALVAFGVGSAVIGVIGGVGAALLAGANLPLTVASLFTSHASALFAIVPLFLIPVTVPLRAPRWEPIVQSIALVALTIVVFAPAATLALTFFIITTLMWGAYRLPPLAPALQTIVLSFAATISTGLGIGPFAILAEGDVRAAIFSLQLFVMTHAAAGVFVSGQAHDWTASTDALAARERDAQRVAEELRRLNQQKDDFISTVSHELRTPVTSIIGFSEELLDDSRPPEVVQAGRVIHRNARRLADVIEDVLELSRLSTQVTSNRPAAPLDLAELVRHCAEDTVGSFSADRDLSVDLRGVDRPVTITVVEQDLVRVCSNILSNALKLSPDGGVVTITLSEHPDHVELAFADDGPGIPLDEQEAVWGRFYRVQSTAAHRAVPGTGLGLPIVRSLIEARIGGEVSLTSDGQHGTTVTVRIPRQPPALAAAPATPAAGSSPALSSPAL
jgi:signal transduction histidine kinase